jgi:hypothetical protein
MTESPASSRRRAARTRSIAAGQSKSSMVAGCSNLSWDHVSLQPLRERRPEGGDPTKVKPTGVPRITRVSPSCLLRDVTGSESKIRTAGTNRNYVTDEFVNLEIHDR